MTSAYLTFDLNLTLIFNVYKVFTKVIPMSKYRISTMKETEVVLFFNDRELIEGRLLKHPKVQVSNVQNTSYLIVFCLH